MNETRNPRGTLRTGLPNEPPPPSRKKRKPPLATVYRIGQRFRVDGEVYLLAQSLPYRVLLINLESGNRWSNAQHVVNPRSVSMEEMSNLLGGDMVDFELLPD